MSGRYIVTISSCLHLELNQSFLIEERSARKAIIAAISKDNRVSKASTYHADCLNEIKSKLEIFEAEIASRSQSEEEFIVQLSHSIRAQIYSDRMIVAYADLVIYAEEVIE